jgi:hypothetical protein
MVDDGETTQIDFGDVEIELCRLPDVVAARVVANSFGEPIEVHILAHTGKHAKQIVRDVQSVALTSFGIDLDRRIVSVVQLSSNGDLPAAATNGSSASAPPASSHPRPPQLVAVESRTADRRASVRITLAVGEGEAMGTSEGPVSAGARARHVATATLAALLQLDDTAADLDIEATSIARVGDDDIVTVTLLYAGPTYEQRLVGSALVTHQQLDEAAARAFLDAANRRPGVETHST